METYPLHCKVLESDIDGVRYLVAQGAHLDNLDDLGHTALHWAVFRGDIEIVRILLEAGANPNVVARDGVTATWRAYDFGLSDIEQILRSFGGQIITDDKFDRKSFGIFGKLIGKDLPPNDA